MRAHGGFPQYHNIQLDLNTAAAHSHTSHTAAALAAATPAAAFGGGSKAGGGGGVARPSRPCGDAGASLGLVQSIDCTVPGLPENADFAGFQRGDLGKCLYVQSGLCVVGAMRHGALGDGSQCPPPPVPALPADPASACPQARVLAPRTACAKGPMPGPALPGNGSGAAGFIPARPTPKRSGTCPDTQIGRTGRKRCLFAINDAGSGTLRGLRARREARPPLYRRNASCARRTYDRRTCGSGRGRQPGENPGTAFRGHLGADGAA